MRICLSYTGKPEYVHSVPLKSCHVKGLCGLQCDKTVLRVSQSYKISLSLAMEIRSKDRAI